MYRWENHLFKDMLDIVNASTTYFKFMLTTVYLHVINIVTQ